MIMLKVFIVVGVLLETNRVNSLFCSAYCAPNQCTGLTNTSCTGCDPPFLFSSPSCLLDPTSNYVFLADQTTIWNSFSAIRGSCGTYNYYGPEVFGSIMLQYLTPITTAHYCVRLIVWMLLQDDWGVNDNITVTNALTNVAIKQSVSTASTRQAHCPWSAQLQNYVKLDLEVPHTGINTVDFRISTDNTRINFWGIEDYYMLIGKCDPICLQCTDATNTSCSQCAASYWLSGNTCDVQCLPLYGISSTPFVCIACSVYCLECEILSTNCSLCAVIVPYESFLSGTSCVQTCPPTTFANIASHQCEPCDNPNCQVCSTLDPSLCSQCDLSTYLHEQDCVAACPEFYFINGRICSLCDPSCQVCTGVPSPCSACASSFFLYANTCPTTCPVGYFPHSSTRVCRDCPTYCVTATLTLSVSASGQSLVAVLTFSQSIDFSNFPIHSFYYIDSTDPDLDMNRFNSQVSIIDSKTLSLQLTVAASINLTDTTFTAGLYAFVTNHTSIMGNYFSQDMYLLQDSLIWTVLVPPQMSEPEKKAIEQLESLNDGVNEGLGQKWAQEIKKTGVFSVLFSGAQLSSLIVLCNTLPPQNMYSAARFWGSFVYFEVPQWQSDSHLHKYVVSKKAQQLISPDSSVRLMQTLQEQEPFWRLTRTGHTGYFIIDTYMQCFLLVLCWAVLGVVKCCDRRSGSHMRTNTKSMLFNLVHKVHEIAIFYVALSVAFEAVTFSNHPAISIKYASLGVSVVAILYFLAYHTYIFYRLIPYARVELQSRKYKLFVEKFSYFLRDLRFDEYPKLLQWTPRHMLRPYSYVVVGYIRLVLMVCCIPLFQGFDYGCISCLVFLQLLQTCRFFFTWPYESLWRNTYRAVQQILLCLIFLDYLYLDVFARSLYSNLNTVTEAQTSFYFALGWIGFTLLFIYNIMFVIYQVIDIVIGCKFTNWQRMESSRQKYYTLLMDELEEHELLNEHKLFNDPKIKKGCWVRCVNAIQGCYSGPIDIKRYAGRNGLKSLIRKGNLIGRNLDELPALRVLIEECIFRKTDSNLCYQAIMEKVPGVFMRPDSTLKKKNNLLVPERTIKKFQLNKYDPSTKAYFRLVQEMFAKSQTVNIEKLTIRTFLKIDQNLYGPAEEIEAKTEWISHEILVKSYLGSEECWKKEEKMQGFPVDLEAMLKMPTG